LIADVSAPFFHSGVFPLEFRIPHLAEVEGRRLQSQINSQESTMFNRVFFAPSRLGERLGCMP